MSRERLRELRNEFVDALARLHDDCSKDPEESDAAARALVAALDCKHDWVNTDPTDQPDLCVKCGAQRSIPAPSVPPPMQFETEAGRAATYLHSHGYKAESDLILCLYRSHEEMKRRMKGALKDVSYVHDLLLERSEKSEATAPWGALGAAGFAEILSRAKAILECYESNEL